MPSDTSSIPPGFDPSRDVVLDPRTLHGLAHPLRLRLRAELIEHGPATASQLAARIGESSGSTSYHLRQLAAYGFIVDDPARGDGRERYWRAAHRSTWFDMSLASPHDRAVGGEYMRAVANLYANRILRFAAGIESAVEHLGSDWAEADEMSDFILDLELDEAVALRRQFHELCTPYRHDENQARPGTRRVVVQFQILPMAESP
jgi:DNA-binding transcriptional ArsR family regulator